VQTDFDKVTMKRDSAAKKEGEVTRQIGLVSGSLEQKYTEPFLSLSLFQGTLFGRGDDGQNRSLFPTPGECESPRTESLYSLFLARHNSTHVARLMLLNYIG
jgi:hypothetical protein